MATEYKTAGVAGSVTLTTKNQAAQLIVPVSVPVVKWYTDPARTLGELTLPTTGSGSTYVATWTAAQAPTSAAPRYLHVTIEVSAGVFDTDADDDVSFVDAVSSIAARYLTLAEVRALPNLADSTKFTDAEITAAIDWFEATFERYTGVAWVPRNVTDERHYLTSADGIILNHMFPRSVSAVRYYSTATASTVYTAAELADLRVDSTGIVRRISLGRFTSAYGIVAVDYSHGFDAPPADIIEAAKVAVRAHLLDEYQANRQFSVATEAGIVRTSTPGEGRPFGLPEVDAVANAYRGGLPSPIPGVA